MLAIAHTLTSGNIFGEANRQQIWMSPMNDSSSLPAGQTPTHPPLDVLAEFELVRRKSELFERRLASWESGLLELRQRLHALETTRDPASPIWMEALGDLKHRIERLERRRRRQVAPPTPASATHPTLPDASAPPRNDDATAIVNARWSTERASAGETLVLTADIDGVPESASIAMAIYALNTSQPIAHVHARCDEHLLRAEWTIPSGLGRTELFFDIEFSGVRARSNLLVLD